MPKALTLTLTDKQKKQLTSYRDRHPKPYVRERAAALLQVAMGLTITQVATEKLFRTRDPETIGDWLHRYEQDGLTGLFIKKGRGRKSAFFPATRDRRRGA
jgi:transposase